MLLFIYAVFVFQSKSRHFIRGSQTMKMFGIVNCDFWDISGKFWKWHCLRKTPSSNLMILVSFCWESSSIHINAHNFFILSLVFLKLLIVGVAFFSWPPCIFKQEVNYFGSFGSVHFDAYFFFRYLQEWKQRHLRFRGARDMLLYPGRHGRL